MMKELGDAQITNNRIIQMLEKYGKVKLSKINPEFINMGEDLISKLDLCQIVFDGKPIRFDEITKPIEMVNFLTSKSKIGKLSKEYISHYTSFKAAKKIIESRKLFLSNPTIMNDGLEFGSDKFDCSKIYFASFSIESGENMGMWSMYGQPWNEGVKISIPRKLFMTWVDMINQVYYVDSNTYRTSIVVPIAENRFKPSLSRMAYVERDSKGNVLQILCGDKLKNDKLKDVDSPLLIGLIKDVAWRYENEIRLRVDLRCKLSEDKIAIDIPNEIVNSMVITTSPRFDNSISKVDFRGVADIRKSIFAGKLNRVYCDRCKH